MQQQQQQQQQQQTSPSQPQDESGYGIVQVSSFLGSAKQNRMVKEALSADFADQVELLATHALPLFNM